MIYYELIMAEALLTGWLVLTCVLVRLGLAAAGEDVHEDNAQIGWGLAPLQ
jgi:hypothetical protein